MNNLIYNIYKEYRMISNNKTIKEMGLDTELNENIQRIEENYPQIRERYQREKYNQASFTPHQIDFICYTIGDWYMKWKDNMATGEGKCHRLGIAKEQLKTMICGE